MKRIGAPSPPAYQGSRRYGESKSAKKQPRPPMSQSTGTCIPPRLAAIPYAFDNGFMDYPAQRRRLLRDSLHTLDVDGVLVSSEPNVTYLTGFSGDSSY